MLRVALKKTRKKKVKKFAFDHCKTCSERFVIWRDNFSFIFQRKEDKEMSEKRCYTVQELQEILGVSRPTIYNLLKKKEFRWIQLDGGKYRLPERYESILPALKNGTPIRLNTIKLPEKNQGKNCNPGPIPLRKSRICWVLMISWQRTLLLFSNHVRDMKFHSKWSISS